MDFIGFWMHMLQFSITISQNAYATIFNYNKSVPVGKCLTSAKIKINNFHWGSVRKFQNVSQLETSWEEASPKCRSWVETTKRIFLNAQDGKFPRFLGKNLVPGKWHSGMQTSKKYQLRLHWSVSIWAFFYDYERISSRCLENIDTGLHAILVKSAFVELGESQLWYYNKNF